MPSRPKTCPAGYHKTPWHRTQNTVMPYCPLPCCPVHRAVLCPTAYCLDAQCPACRPVPTTQGTALMPTALRLLVQDGGSYDILMPSRLKKTNTFKIVKQNCNTFSWNYCLLFFSVVRVFYAYLKCNLETRMKISNRTNKNFWVWPKPTHWIIQFINFCKNELQGPVTILH